MSRRNDQRPWTATDDAALRSLYPNTNNQVLADVFTRSVSGIKNRAQVLGLHKSEAYKAVHTGRIQPGNTPWNKGRKGWQAGGRSTQTQFKPGRRAVEAHNYQPIGSVRLSKDGYLERKVSDDASLYPARRWVALHRLVWEAAHGPIPAGHIVVFKTGQHTHHEPDVTLDRLECITRRENMRRNSYHANYPPEVARLVQLKGAITRQVNRISKEATP